MSRKRIEMIGDIGATSAGSGWYRLADGSPRYRAASGDTVNRLAATYLGSSSRARELWNLQPWRGDSRHANDINRIFVGDVFTFPADGVATAEALGVLAGSSPLPFSLSTFGNNEVTAMASQVIPAFIPAALPSPLSTSSGNKPGTYTLPEITIYGDADDEAAEVARLAALEKAKNAPPSAPSSGLSSTAQLVGGVALTLATVWVGSKLLSGRTVRAPSRRYA